MNSLDVERFARWKRAEQKLSELSELADQAERFIGGIAESLKGSNRPEFEIKSRHGTRLEFRLLGMTFIVRAEASTSKPPIGHISTYVLDDAAPESRAKIDLEYTFDGLGNVDGRLTIAEAVQEFRSRFVEELDALTTIVL
jgi:hypothetical protein